MPTDDVEPAEFVRQWLGCEEGRRQAGVKEARRRDAFSFISQYRPQQPTMIVAIQTAAASSFLYNAGTESP